MITYWNTIVQTSVYTDTTGGSCVIRGTKINIDTTAQVNVEDLVVGDDILSKDGPFNTDDLEDLRAVETTDMSQPTPIHSVDAISHANVTGVCIFNNGFLTVTKDHYHIFYRDGKWISRPSHHIVVGDYFLNLDGTKRLVTSVTHDAFTAYDVVKVDVEPNDTYWANGVLTHNKKHGGGIQ